MTVDLNQVRAHLEKKQRELQEEIVCIQARYPLPSASPPSFAEREDREEAAREMVDMEDEPSLLRNQQRLLEHVELALERLDEGTYGLYCECSQPIAEALTGSALGHAR